MVMQSWNEYSHKYSILGLTQGFDSDYKRIISQFNQIGSDMNIIVN